MKKEQAKGQIKKTDFLITNDQTGSGEATYSRESTLNYIKYVNGKKQ